MSSVKRFLLKILRNIPWCVVTNFVSCCRPMGQAPSLDRQTSLGGGHPSAPPSTPAHPPPAPDQPSYFNSMVGKSSSSQQLKPPTQPVNENSSQPQPKKEPAKKAEPEKSKKGGGSGLFGSFFGKFLPKPGNQVSNAPFLFRASTHFFPMTSHIP